MKSSDFKMRMNSESLNRTYNTLKNLSRDL